MRSNPSSVVVKKQSILIKMYLLPPFLKLLVATFLFFIICITGFIFFKQQAALEYAKLNAKKSTLEKEVSNSASSYGQMSFLTKNAALAKQQYEEILKKFPSESQIGDLLASITKLGTAEGLKFVSFKPSSPENHAYYADEPVEVVVNGNFHQLCRFLSGIANLPGSVVVVNKFSLARNKDEKENLLSLQFTATLYYKLPFSAEIKV